MINKSDNESTQKLINKSVNKPDNKSINKTVISNATSWYDTDKFNEILATIDANNFNHKNEIGKLKFNDVNDLINSIKGNTISEADAKKKLNELNKISLFDDLKIFLMRMRMTMRMRIRMRIKVMDDGQCCEIKQLV